MRPFFNHIRSLVSVSSVSGFWSSRHWFPGPQSLPAAHNPILRGCSLVQHAFYLHLLFIFISSRYCRISDHIFSPQRVSLSISLSQSIPYRVLNGRVLTMSSGRFISAVTSAFKYSSIRTSHRSNRHFLCTVTTVVSYGYSKIPSSSFVHVFRSVSRMFLRSSATPF